MQICGPSEHIGTGRTGHTPKGVSYCPAEFDNGSGPEPFHAVSDISRTAFLVSRSRAAASVTLRLKRRRRSRCGSRAAPWLYFTDLIVGLSDKSSSHLPDGQAGSVLSRAIAVLVSWASTPPNCISLVTSDPRRTLVELPHDITFRPTPAVSNRPPSSPI